MQEPVFLLFLHDVLLSIASGLERQRAARFFLGGAASRFFDEDEDSMVDDDDTDDHHIMDGGDMVDGYSVEVDSSKPLRKLRKVSRDILEEAEKIVLSGE